MKITYVYIYIYVNTRICINIATEPYHVLKGVLYS